MKTVKKKHVVFFMFFVSLYLVLRFLTWGADRMRKRSVEKAFLSNENVGEVVCIKEVFERDSVYDVWIVMKDGTKVALEDVKFSTETKRLKYGDIRRIGKYGQLRICRYMYPSGGFEINRTIYTLDEYPVLADKERRFDVDELLNNIPAIVYYFSTLPCVPPSFRGFLMHHDYDAASILVGMDLTKEYKIGYSFLFTYDADADEFNPWL